MSIEAGLVAELRGDAGVSAVVGTRIHPNVAPQDSTLPYLVYTRVPGEREFDMGGVRSFTKVRVQIDCWSADYETVKDLADAVRSALNGVGIASPKLLGSQSVQLVELESDQDLTEVEGDVINYRVSQDWIITYLET